MYHPPEVRTVDADLAAHIELQYTHAVSLSTDASLQSCSSNTNNALRSTTRCTTMFLADEVSGPGRGI
jgi:hypothetical protein